MHQPTTLHRVASTPTCGIGLLLTALAWPVAIHASIAVAPMPRQVDVTDSLDLTLLVFEDGQAGTPPDSLEASLTANPQAPVKIILNRVADPPAVPGQ
ncbi:MAG TPA: hypothetical protein VLC08_06695, partial [Chitinolyticbacter sp.]|nr:hypothetical protein [Chitinolyticbacter sp.]